MNDAYDWWCEKWGQGTVDRLMVMVEDFNREDKNRKISTTVSLQEATKETEETKIR